MFKSSFGLISTKFVKPVEDLSSKPKQRSKSLNLSVHDKVKVKQPNRCLSSCEINNKNSESIALLSLLPIPKLKLVKPQKNLPKRHSLQSFESNTESTLTRSILCSPNPTDQSLDRLPCSASLIDLFLLVFRYKDACEKLIDLCIPSDYVKLNHKFFQAKFNCLNNIHQVGLS